MGLDSYLYATEEFTLASWTNEENCNKVKEVANLMKGNDFLVDPEEGMQSAEVKIEIAYWRKANQIHKFFVDKCAGGKDNCEEVYVEREVLQDLLNRCETILKDKSQARELLPTQSGFFYGSTEYDEYYYYDLERTIPILKKILKNAPESWALYYQASW
jgi:hypothetical protein